MNNSTRKKNLFMGLVYGLTAGFAFAFFAWGLDAIMLLRAHAAFPWVKFIPGMLICTVAGGLVGWVTIKVQKALLTLPLWIALAYLFTKLAIWLPVHVAPAIIRVFDRPLGDHLVYQNNKAEFFQYFLFSFIATGVVAIICGLLENVLIEQSHFSSGKVAAVIPLVICFLCFSLVGNSTDTMLNNFMRKPVRVVDNLLQFALDNSNKDVPNELARSMHLAALNPIKGILQSERRLIIQSYDQTMYQMKVLIDFDGNWAECLTVFDQVTVCNPVTGAK
ncbi:MAG TPA: hypothetical protein PKK59_02615 [Anaerolineaceae bacterium]|nr:hypothetical protein [Anaerolineaceae bacterium]